MTRPNTIQSHRAITLLTQGYSNPFVAKTAISMLRYRGSEVVAVLDKDVSAGSADELFGMGGSIPVVKQLPTQSDALYIGIAPPGGKLPPEWKPIILTAIGRKMDIVSGLHDFLVRDADYVRAAESAGVQLVDVRQNHFASTATGAPFRQDCVRILTIGQDCSVGKMVAALEVNQGLVNRGLNSQFLATGQTGIMICGTGIPVDCVVADFVNGAAEQLVRENDDRDFLLIEGQGSISHPAYSAVTVGLLHGCRPDGMIFCYEAGRRHVKGFKGIELPAIKQQMECCLAMAKFLNPCQIIGFAINTRNLNAVEAMDEVNRIEQQFALPACDVYRDGTDKLVEACVLLQQKVENSS